MGNKGVIFNDSYYQAEERKERNWRIAHLKRTGKSYNEIAKQYGLAKDTIKNICHKEGVSGDTRKKKYEELKLF